MFWKQTVFTLAAILNFLKSSISQTFIKTKRIWTSETIGFETNIHFIFKNVGLIQLLKKFNMATRVKMVCFQIIQNVFCEKSTLELSLGELWGAWAAFYPVPTIVKSTKNASHIQKKVGIWMILQLYINILAKSL